MGFVINPKTKPMESVIVLFALIILGFWIVAKIVKWVFGFGSTKNHGPPNPIPEPKPRPRPNNYLPPPVTTLQRDSILHMAEGSVILNTDNNTLEVYRNNSWGKMQETSES